MPAPNIKPEQRDPAHIAPTDSYRRHDPVWVYRGDAWRAGVVESVSARAATVTYRPNGSRGTGVDTLTAQDVLARFEVDPLLDHRE